MKNRFLSLACVLLGISSMTQADVDVSLLITPQFNRYQILGVFALPTTLVKQPASQSEHIVELKTQHKGFTLMANMAYLIENNGSDGTNYDSKGAMLEAYYANTIADVEYAIGKKITSWGVGYGFRPIDIIAQQDLQTTALQTQEGKTQLILDYYFNLASVTLVAVPDNNDDLLGVRYFNSMDDWDVQAVVAKSPSTGWQLGLAGIWIADDSMSLHTEWLLHEKYQQNINSLIESNSPVPLSDHDPFISMSKTNAIKLLVGLNYSWSKHNIIAEYWYDNTVYSQQQWDALFTLAKKQKDLLGTVGISDNAVYGNLAYDLSAFNVKQMVQHNVFIRWVYDTDDWQPSVSALYAPEDSGVILTLNSSKDYEYFKVNVGTRWFTGNAHSVYAQLLTSSQFYMNISRDF